LEWGSWIIIFSAKIYDFSARKISFFIGRIRREVSRLYKIDPDVDARYRVSTKLIRT